MTLALFRIIESAGGSISIDGQVTPFETDKPHLFFLSLSILLTPKNHADIGVGVAEGYAPYMGEGGVVDSRGWGGELQKGKHPTWGLVSVSEGRSV